MEYSQSQTKYIYLYPFRSHISNHVQFIKIIFGFSWNDAFSFSLNHCVSTNGNSSITLRLSLMSPFFFSSAFCLCDLWSFFRKMHTLKMFGLTMETVIWYYYYYKLRPNVNEWCRMPMPISTKYEWDDEINTWSKKKTTVLFWKTMCTVGLCVCVSKCH